MNHLKRKLEKLTNEQLKHVCNKMSVKHGKSKKSTINILLKPFVKKYRNTHPIPENFQPTSRKMRENFLLWTAVPGLGRPLPTMETRVYGLLSGQHQFDGTDLAAIEYLINIRSDQDKPIYKLNRDIIQYHVNNPAADIEQVLHHMEGKRRVNRRGNRRGNRRETDG